VEERKEKIGFEAAVLEGKVKENEVVDEAEVTAGDDAKEIELEGVEVDGAAAENEKENDPDALGTGKEEAI